MFVVDYETGAIRMHQGDTGSFIVEAHRKSGTDWTANDRMLFTIWDGSKAIIQRLYRLDRQDLGNGVVLIEFHNEDTDKIPTGNYTLERRYIINPIWEIKPGGAIPTENVANALTANAKIVDGHIVRVTAKGQTTFEIQTIYGEV